MIRMVQQQQHGVVLSRGQRKALAELLPKFTDRLMLEQTNPRKIPFTSTGCSQAGSRHFSRLRGFGEGMFTVVSGGVAFRPMIRAQIACQSPPRLAVFRSTIC